MVRLFQALAAALILSIQAGAASAQDKPRIVAVNYPLQYLAQRLLGDDAEVEFPVPGGVDPSFWRPSISDISAVQSADLILLNGAGFASWIDRVSLPRSRVVNTSRAIEGQFIATESITHSHGDGGEHSHEGLASYTWLDPTLAGAQAEAIAAAIATRNLADPNEVYAKLAELLSDLEKLDADAQAALAAAQNVPLIATHPRYQYLAARYGLSMTSLEWEASAAPGADELAELQALMATTGSRVLIWEASPSSEGLEATAQLGLENVVFEPMAHPVTGGSFLEAFAAAVDALSDAVAATPGN